MYNQPFQGNSPTPQQQHQMHQQMHQQQMQMQPNVSSAASMAQHQMVIASQGMRQQFSGSPFHNQHPSQQQQQQFMQMPAHIYSHSHLQQQQQMHQQMSMQHSGLPPGHIGPVLPPHPIYPPIMGQQQQQTAPGFPHQLRFPQQPPGLNPQIMNQTPQHLQKTSLMNPSIFASSALHQQPTQRPPSLPSPQQVMAPQRQVPPLSQSLQPRLPTPPPPIPMSQTLFPSTQVSGLVPLMGQPQQLMPAVPQVDVPYYDLPAGLMVPLVKPEDHNYKPIDPKMVKLPPPQAPSERLLRAVEEFYAPPSHERPRDADGWEFGALSEFFKIKQEAIRKNSKNKVFSENPKDDKGEAKKENLQGQETVITPKRRYKEEKSPVSKQSSARKSRSRSPKHTNRSRRRRSSSSSSKSSKSGSSSGSSRSTSRSPRRRRSGDDHHHSIRRDNSRSGGNKSSRQTRKQSRSLSPEEFKPSFATGFEVKDKSSKLDDSNKGAQLLMKMGWTGSGGLGSSQQGISEPVPETGFIRDQGNMYHGIGVEEKRSDVYESYRKSRGQAFLDRIQKSKEDK